MDVTEYSELVDVTRSIKNLEIRQKVLKEKALTNLLEGNGDQVVLGDKSKVYISNRKVANKKPPIEERVDPDLVRLHSKALYKYQKEAFEAMLKAYTLAIPQSQQMILPKDDAPKKPILMVTPKKSSHDPSFERIKIKEGYSRKQAKEFLDLYHIGQKYGTMDLQDAWTTYINDSTGTSSQT